MCTFGYRRYDECHHKSIEIVSYCQKRLWRAGMNGQLSPCPETHYRQHITELKPVMWDGMLGYCKRCQRDYMVCFSIRSPDVGQWQDEEDLLEYS